MQRWWHRWSCSFSSYFIWLFWNVLKIDWDTSPPTFLSLSPDCVTKLPRSSHLPVSQLTSLPYVLVSWGRQTHHHTSHSGESARLKRPSVVGASYQREGIAIWHSYIKVRLGECEQNYFMLISGRGGVKTTTIKEEPGWRSSQSSEMWWLSPNLKLSITDSLTDGGRC